MEPQQQEQQVQQATQTNSFAVPLAIIIAGALIAGAVYLNGKPATPTPTQNIQGSVVDVKPVTATDHILGNPNAKILMVEYSDLECPFCKNFQNTMHQALADYQAKGEVAWVYRHFTVHSKAPHEAEAAECVNELGGNDKFFQFIDKIFAVTKADDNLDPAVLTKTAVGLGVDETKFQNCLDSGKYKSFVAQATKDAVAAGGQGTPYTVLVTKDAKYPITAGAIPYSELKPMIESILNKTK